MRKIMFVGRSEAGKTTLMQALKGDKIKYHKTQYVNYFDVIIDTPGEYMQAWNLAAALEIYSFEANVIGLLISAVEPYSMYPPCCTAVSTRECIGIVTKIDRPDANPERAEYWLRLAGCEKVFWISSYTGEGVAELLTYLKEEGDVLPWEVDSAKDDCTNDESDSNQSGMEELQQ